MLQLYISLTLNHRIAILMQSYGNNVINDLDFVFLMRQ